MPLDHILHVLELFERTRFSIFESQLKQLNCSILLYSHFKSKTRLKSCIMELNVVSDLAQQGKYSILPSAIFQQ